MLDDQTKRAVETMVQCGCEKDSLKSMFPNVTEQDIDYIIAEVNANKPSSGSDNNISINCS